MRSSLLLCLVLLTFNVFAQTDRQLANGQLAYYGANFSVKQATKQSLFKILSSTHSIVSNQPDIIASSCQGTCYSHTSVGYEGARKIMFGELFIQKDNRGNFVQDVYCGKKFYFRSANDVSNMHSEVNIEHTWPQSRFSTAFDKNMQKSDMHHLYPTDSDANNRRANHEFGLVKAGFSELNVDDCEASQLGVFSGHQIFTPPPVHRGNVARSIFYFSVRYSLQIAKDEEKVLREWNKADPIDAAEKTRHEIIAKYEKVRNPFIDYPELADTISDF